ncbi:sterol desaturase family protein [Robbsia sp. Bb-Pol-6]|uniref:Sterol desaturase family protein n=1 Tax=Robbsia betulipollinis TaxID=2981849 RepID=A0ABT3ZJ48_9BURK|nr:sterol desaturase family protein [Robbsia betulipollinis]MCY0386387.1 sterol desaturase family protein [Robbsia betulipollinis]
MFHTLFSAADTLVSWLQTEIFTTIVEPLFYKVGLMDYDEDTYDALYWFIIAICEIGLMYAVLRPLEALWPAERWTDRRSVRVDAIYTWITRLGVINVLFFFFLQPLFDSAQEALRMHGIHNVDLDSLWPGMARRPLASFLFYLIVLDFAGYWYHRWQHRFGWWWELHAVHHSQRQMSLWSDDRNHIADTLIEAGFFASIALLIGVQPSQFVLLLAASQIAQSVQHANTRIAFGPVLERLVVSPGFHRRHHAIGYGHEGVWYGCNFGVLFPWWDMLFRTVSWNRQIEPTGIRDQLDTPHGAGRNYGEGFWSQQWLGMGRSAHRVGLWLSGRGRRNDEERSGANG